MGQVMDVEGCTALITGANRGLGRVLAGMTEEVAARLLVFSAAPIMCARTSIRSPFSGLCSRLQSA